MKKVLYSSLKTKIIITFGYMLLGTYTGANQLNIAEVKEVSSMN